MSKLFWLKLEGASATMLSVL